MSYAYPATKRVEVDLLKGEKLTPFSCEVGEGVEVGYSVYRSSGSAPVNMTSCGYMSSANRFFAYSDGYVYSSLSAQSFMQLAALTAQKPIYVEQYSGGETQAFILGDTFAVMHTGAYQTSRQFEGNLYDGVMHYGRLFGIDRTDRYMLRFSGEGGVLDWTNGGYLLLKRGEGMGVSLYSMDSRVVILREQGITQVSAFGNYENYKVEFNLRCDKVISFSGCVVLDKLYFLTESGLKVYSGGKIEAIKSLQARHLHTVKSGICWGQLYILSCTHDKCGKVLYVYDALNGSEYLIDSDMEIMCVAGEVYFFQGGGVYKMRKSAFTLKNSTTFSSGRLKVLKSVTLEGEGKYNLTVSNGKVSREFFEVSGRVDMLFSGREFFVTISGSSRLESATAVAEVIDGI